MFKSIDKIFILCLLAFKTGTCYSQAIRTGTPAHQTLDRIAFYNTENLFYPSDDSLTDDKSFTPHGEYHWTYSRYKIKIDHIGRCLALIGIDTPPAIIGLAEIENKQVLVDLVNCPALAPFNYRIIHKESPDPRGVDVGFLYRPDIFQPVFYEAIDASSPDHPLRTREMLQVSGQLKGAEIHIFVVHWPSRRGGQIGSEIRRIQAAEILKIRIQSIMDKNPFANILIMGDFNDNPEDVSLKTALGALPPRSPDQQNLINLMFPLAARNEGSYCRQHNFLEWDNLDQIIVSLTMFTGENGLKVDKGEAHIFREAFLLDRDQTRPWPTYLGLRYLGGFSDHLPVYTDIGSPDP